MYLRGTFKKMYSDISLADILKLKRKSLRKNIKALSLLLLQFNKESREEFVKEIFKDTLGRGN